MYWPITNFVNEDTQFGVEAIMRSSARQRDHPGVLHDTPGPKRTFTKTSIAAAQLP